MDIFFYICNSMIDKTLKILKKILTSFKCVTEVSSLSISKFYEKCGISHNRVRLLHITEARFFWKNCGLLYIVSQINKYQFCDFIIIFMIFLFNRRLEGDSGGLQMKPAWSLVSTEVCFWLVKCKCMHIQFLKGFYVHGTISKTGNSQCLFLKNKIKIQST